MQLYFQALYSSNSYTHFVKQLKIIAMEIIFWIEIHKRHKKLYFIFLKSTELYNLI